MTLKTVAIIGAGPAGCAAALALSAIGVPCTVFECGAPGKDKACGDAFVPDAVQELAVLGVHESDLAHFDGRPFQAISLRGPIGNPLRVPIGQCQGWVVRRAAIDQHLRSLAARTCEVCYATAASAVEPLPLSNRVHFRNRTSELFSGVVIAAGSACNLSHTLGIDGRPKSAVALSAYVPAGLRPEELECYFGPSLRPGYGWRFPIAPDCANIGICLFSASPGPRLRTLATGFTRSLGVSSPACWRGGLAQLWSREGAWWHRPEGIVSCGDAAGLIDPSSGEGLTAALRSGWQAGRAMGEFVQSGRDVRALQAYSMWTREYFSARYASSTARNFWDAWCGLAPKSPERFFS